MRLLQNRPFRVLAAAIIGLAVIDVTVITTSGGSSTPQPQQVVEQRAFVYDEATELRRLKARATRARPRATTSPQARPQAVHKAPTPVKKKPRVLRASSLGGVWAALRQCESGGNYRTNTGNGYYGAYQFALGTWRSLGYSGYPHEAAPAVQDEAARRLQARSGWGQWPACSRKLGLR